MRLHSNHDVPMTFLSGDIYETQHNMAKTMTRFKTSFCSTYWQFPDLLTWQHSRMTCLVLKAKHGTL